MGQLVPLYAEFDGRRERIGSAEVFGEGRVRMTIPTRYAEQLGISVHTDRMSIGAAPMNEDQLLVAKCIDAVVNAVNDLDPQGPRINGADLVVTWFAKVLQNYKAIINHRAPNGICYEVTYDGNKQRTYIDTYQKLRNVEQYDQTFMDVQKVQMPGQLPLQEWDYENMQFAPPRKEWPPYLSELKKQQPIKLNPDALRAAVDKYEAEKDS